MFNCLIPVEKGTQASVTLVQKVVWYLPLFPKLSRKTPAVESVVGAALGVDRQAPLLHRLGKSFSINGVRVCSDKDLLLLTVSKNQ